jgi:thiol-disulfide isomerase/thioredoxin
MNSLKKQLPLIIRIVIAALFLLSAIAKSFPIWAFEKQLVDLGIVDWCNAYYLARLIIALETAIAIAILQNHYIKTFVIPVTILLLVAFCGHLGLQMYQHGAMNGNCGCFGQLIPMTPLEAFIKNIVTIFLLAYLYKNVRDKEKGSNKFIVILFIYFLSAFIMFFFFPFCPCPEKNTTNIVLPKINLTDTLGTDSSIINLGKDSNLMIINKDTSLKIKTTKDSTTTVSKQIDAPKATSSKFSIYQTFSGKPTNLDEGKKIVCLFVPGCDHCRDAAKEMVKLSKSHNLPPVYVLFMNEETFKIPEFFNEVKSVFPYFVIEDIPTFFKLLGNNATTPGINYLWNGNIIKSYEGLDDHKFNALEMAKIIESNIK